MNLEEIKVRFIDFAETECKGRSNLYYQLSKRVAQDDSLSQLAASARPGQPIPNIFFASIHYLLLKDEKCTLANFYPSIVKEPTEEIPFDEFKKFCIGKSAEIRYLISTKLVQTNEITRCAYLMPVFSRIIWQEDRPSTIIDIGTSAGLTLNFDKYEYCYNEKKIYGNSGIVVKSKVLGPRIPRIYPITQSLKKIGIDQNIIDLQNEDEILWLKALIWPDQLERFRIMEAALKEAESSGIELVQANTIREFKNVIENVQEKQNLIIFATHVLYQFSNEQRQEFYLMLDEIGKVRDFYFLSVEGIRELLAKYSSKDLVIELTTYKNSNKTEALVAETNGHGNWIKWHEYGQ